jgi:hypothetical protein
MVDKLHVLQQRLTIKGRVQCPIVGSSNEPCPILKFLPAILIFFAISLSLFDWFSISWLPKTKEKSSQWCDPLNMDMNMGKIYRWPSPPTAQISNQGESNTNMDKRG